MKLCPNCKAELDDNARFCLRCMTSLDEKELIPPLVRQDRRWPLVLPCFLILSVLLVVTAILTIKPPIKTPEEINTSTIENPPTETVTESQETIPNDVATVSHTVDGITYTFRSATKEDDPTAIDLSNHFVLIQVEGTPSNGRYQVPSFVGDDMSLLVTVVSDGAFANTYAKAIDLGYNVRYVWGDAFGGYALTDLYLHEDVLIDRAAFSGCTKDLIIHCPEYLENTKGEFWSNLAVNYGFRWQPEII